MSFAFNIPFKVERGENMTVVSATSDMYTDGEVHDWLESLGYSPSGTYVLVRKSPYRKNRNNQYWMMCHAFVPNVNGLGKWGAVRKNNSLSAATQMVNITQGGTATDICQVLSGDEYYVIPFVLEA